MNTYHVKKAFKSIIILCMSLAILSGCYGQREKIDASKSHEIMVFAASSMKESMEQIKKQYEKEHEDINIKLHFASTSRLRVQIEQGVDADIFLSANEDHYRKLEDEKMIQKGQKILENTMVLISSKVSNPAIDSLKDLTKKNKFILAQKDVPAGKYALKVLDQLNECYGKDYKEKVLENVVSKEDNVKQVLAKVVLGEGDAAFVYGTDVTDEVKDKVKVISIKDIYNIKASYFLGILKNSQAKQEVKLFYDYLLSDEAMKIFKAYKFVEATNK